MATATLIGENIYLELACTSEVWPIIMVGGNGSMQADMVLEKELRVPHLDKQGT